jgi:hypothetical protein
MRSINSRKEVQAGPDIKLTLLENYLKQKRVGDVVQVVEHLLGKHKALSSNVSATKNKQSMLL